MLRFRVLGPFEVLGPEGPLPLGSARRRALLALLVLNAGRRVGVERLVDELWGEEPPRTATHVVHVYVSDLRKALPEGRLQTVTDGYLLQASPEEVDLVVFERLVGDARTALAAGDAETAVARVDDALGLWRGTVLADLAGEGFVQPEARRLDEIRLAAQELRAAAVLASGGDADLVATLTALTAEHPYRERLHALLVRALAAQGRQADALGAYETVRQRLADELGIDPGAELREAQAAVLRQEVAPAPAPAVVAAARRPAAARVTALLFVDMVGSTTRVAELGDQRWLELVTRYDHSVRQVVEQHGGQVQDSAGDGYFVTFDEPGDAVDAALALTEASAAVGVEVRTGVHAGQVEVSGEKPVGMAVHVAARVAAEADPGGVLVTATVRELLAGADYRFTDRGTRTLKGLDEPRSVWAVEPTSAGAVAAATDAGRGRAPTSTPDATGGPVLAAAADPARLATVAAVGDLLAGAADRELLVVGLVPRPADRPPDLSAMTRALVAARAAATSRARSAVLAARDQVGDAARLAAEQDAALVVLDAAGLLDQRGRLAPEVTAALEVVTADVVLLPDARVEVGRGVAVPFGGTEHDWAAVEVGALLARSSGAPLRVVGGWNEQDDASRLVARVALAVQRSLGVDVEPVLAAPSLEGLVGAIADLTPVLGMSERWRSEGVGVFRARLVEHRPALLVRRGMRPGLLAPPGSQTRFAWSTLG